MTKKLFFLSIALLGGAGILSAQTEAKRAVAETPMTISELFDKVEAGSRSLAVQKTGVEKAQKGIEWARSQRLPDIDASLSVSYIGNVLMTDRDFSNGNWLKSPHFGNSFSVQAQQVVYSGGAITAGIKLAELGKQQAEAGVKFTRQQTRFLALGQYLDLYKVDNRIKVYEKNIELTRRLIADIEEKQKQGMALRNDITRYELQMETLKLGLISLKNNREIINHQLCNALGIDTSMKIVPDTTLTASFGEDKRVGLDGEEAWQRRSLVSSPLIEQSALGVRISEQNEKIAKSEMLPKVAVVAANNFDGPITFELPPIDKNLNVWYFGLGVKYNLGSLYKSNKRVKQQAIATREARESYDVQLERLSNQVQAAYVQYQQTYVELATRKKNVELAYQNYDVINARYLNQLALVTDMVDASNVRLSAELLEVDARIEIVYAYYRMKFAAGEI